MSKAAVYTFREVVNSDEDMQQQIQSLEDYIKAGAAMGMQFTIEELQEVLEEFKDELTDHERGLMSD